MRLSKNFSVELLTRSDIAKRLGGEEDLEIGKKHFNNLRRLCVTVLQPVHDLIGPVELISGYRPEWLNDLIGGSEDSAHIQGLAADIRVSGMRSRDLFQRIIDANAIMFDRLVYEYGEWVHIQAAPPGVEPRRLIEYQFY